MDRPVRASLAQWERTQQPRQPGWYSNSLLSPEEAGDLMAANRLFCQEDERGTLLFARHPHFYRLYAQFSPERPPDLPQLDLPLAAECLSRHGVERPAERAGEQALLDMGFAPQGESARYVRSLAAARLTGDGDCFSRGLQPAWAGPKQAEDLLDLWEQCFSGYHSPLPFPEELARWLAQGQVACLLDAGNRLAAALRLRVEGKMASLWLVAVAPPYRGQGLNHLLQDLACRRARDLGCGKCYLWIAADNEAAIRADRALGFLPDGRVSRQLLSINK